MKNFKRIVGLLLCLAMVLSILPASVVGAAELGAETEWAMQKIDLTDCIVAACSNNFNSSLSFENQDWYTNDYSDFNSQWKDFGALVDGYYYNEVYFGCSHPERADLYIDLTDKYDGAVSLDQLKVYHGGFGAVPSLYVALVLEGGKVIEKSFTLGWEAGVDADPLTWTFDETYDIEGVYIWQNGNAVKAYFGEIELLALKEVEREVVEIVGLDAPTFGYYADGNTDGTITEYYDASYGPANLIDDNHDTYTRSLSYTYSEIQNGEKIPAILFDLGKEFSLAGVEINGYQYGYYNMCDFTIQVYDSTDTWKTVKTVTKAFDTSVGAAGEDTEPVMYRFDAIVGSKVRILVNGVNDMGDEDPDQKVSIDGFCVREIALYNGYGEAPEDSTNSGNTSSILDNLIVMENAPTPTVGYYTDNNTNGAITDYYHSEYVPVNMVNGDITDQARSEYYTHAEIASGAKVPVILFDFGSTTVLGGMDIYGYQTSRYNMEDFKVQVYTNDGWVTAASVTDAFYKEGSFGDPLTGPLTIEFDQLYTTTKLRILVSGLSDMTADAKEDATLAEGSHIRVREIDFYSEEEPGPYIETATVNGVDLSEYVIVYSADEPDYNLRAAQHIRTAIKQRTGRVLNIVEDDTAEAACEILVGDTNRSLSQSVTAPANNVMKFTIQTSGTKIALEADYFIIAGAAYYFTETYIDDASFNVTVSDVTRAPITKKANNYIMLIGDGMGVNQTKLFEAYDVPTSGDFAYSDGEDIFYGYYLPYYGLVETCNSSGTTTDSAAAGTALATGYKTVNTWVGLDKSGNAVQSLTELALSLGMGAAVMTTEEIFGATPAAFTSHVGARSDSSAILEDQAELRADGAIIYDEDYYPYYTAEEWAAAEPAYIKTLNQVAKNDSFFLMYEEAYIDKNGHYSNAPWCFRTVYRFNQAIGFFMEFAMYNPDTLVVITADHETGNMDSTFTYDGNGEHSSQDVPIFAYGAGASAFDTDSSYHNTSIARTFAYMMTGGDTSFGDSQWPILYSSDEPEEPETTEPTTTPTQEPTSPVAPLPQGQVYKIIDNKTYMTGWAGYMDANGALSEAKGEGSCLADGGYGKPAYLNSDIDDEKAAIAEITMSKTFKVGAIEVSGDRNEQLDPTNFEIQAWVNGAWTTIKTVTNAFTGSPRTEHYTFDPVETNKIRLYITSHEGDYCSIGEIELYEVTTGNLVEKVDLTDRNVTADSDVTEGGELSDAVVGTVTDGDKSTIIIFDSNTPTITIDLTNADGTPTNVSAFSLFGHRSGNRPTSVEIKIQTTAGGSYTSVGTYSFSANTGDAYPFAPYYTELGSSYDAYGLQIVVKSVNVAATPGCALAEIELYGVTAIPLDAPTGLTATATKNSITATANSTTGGTLMFKLNDGQWQESGEFTGLEDGTTYTLYAKYVAEDGYIDSAETSITVTTAKDIEISDKVTMVPIVKPNAPTVGYYSDNNTDGPITEYIDPTYPPANLVDGDTDTQGRTDAYGYYYAELATGAKIPVYLFEFDAPRAFTGVEIDTYKAMYYGIEDFTVQVYTTDGEWVTATTVADSFSSKPQEEIVDPETYAFAEPLYGTKLRILVHKIWDMYDWRYDNDVCYYLTERAPIRLREITLMEDPDYVPPTNTQNVLKAPAYLNTTFISADAITVVAPPSTEYPQAQIRYAVYLNGEMVATNYTGVFTGLEHNTAYTFYAQYIGDGETWLNSHVAVNTTATDKDQLPPPTNVEATLGTTTITVTADPVDGGTLTYRLLDENHIAVSAWQESGEFTGLTAGTQYTIQVKYNGDVNHYDSAITELTVVTGHILLAKPTLTVSGTTHNTITLNALAAVEGGSAEYSYSTDGITWTTTTSPVITGLTPDTTYYLRARYVATDSTHDSSLYSEIVTATTKTNNLPAPTLTVTGTTDSSITVTANSNANGTLMFRINGGDWQASGAFTGLDRNTEYTIEAMYVGINGYTDSPIASTTATTKKTQLAAPTGLTATNITANSITVKADTVTGGTLMFRLDGGEWQTSGTFTGLTHGTTYTIEAMYVAADGYIDSPVRTTSEKTLTILSAPELSATSTDTTITVTAPAVTGGTLQFRINGGAWQTSGTFTGLDWNTTYTISAMYVGSTGYIDSGITTISVATTRPSDPTSGQYAYLEAIPESGVTPHVGYNNYPNHEMYAENTVTGSYISDAMFGTLTQIRGDDVTFTNEDLAGYKRLSVVYDLNNGATLIGGVELTGGDYNLTKFSIQVKNTKGVWQTVKFVTNDLFDISDALRNDTVMITFTPVTGTHVRLMIEGYEENPNNAPEIREMVVYEVKEDAAQEKKPVSSGTTQVFDSNKANAYTGETATLTFNEATYVKRLKLFGNTEATSIGAYTVKVQTTKGGDWTQVATGTAFSDAGDNNTCIINLDQEYTVYGIQVISNSGAVTIPEIEVYGTITTPKPADPTPATTPNAVAPTAPTKPAVVSPVQTSPAATEEFVMPTEPVWTETKPGNEPAWSETKPGNEGAWTDPVPDVPVETGPEPTAPVATQAPTQAATQSTTPVQIAISDAEVLIYNDSKSYTTYEEQADAAKIIDDSLDNYLQIGGSTSSTAYAWSTSSHSGNGGKYTPAAILTWEEEKTLTSIELYYMRSDGAYQPIQLIVQAKVDGVWEDVATYDDDTKTASLTLSLEQVTTNQVRVLFTEIYQKSGFSAHCILEEIKLFGYGGSSGSGSTTIGTPGWQKLDLTGTVVGACSYGTSDSSDYSKLNWYSTLNATWSKPWRDAMVDGNPNTDLYFGVSSDTVNGVKYIERADVYFDLSKGAGGYTAINRFVLTHSGAYAVPEVTIILLLKDGTQKKFVYSPNWTKGGSGELDETFDQTYNVIGVYIWESQNLSGSSNDDAAFGEFELYQNTTVQLPTPGNLTTTVTENSITATADTIPAAAGKLQFRINSEAWQDATNGSYTFSNLNAGTAYTIKAQYVATGDGYITTTTPASTSVTTAVPVITEFTVSGTTTAGATVQLYKNSAVVNTTTADNSGNYSFNDVNIGNYTLVVTKPGHTAQMLQITVDKDLTVQTITLVAAYTVSGKTTANATVTLYQNGAVYKTTTADGSGNYSFSAVALGNYTLVFTKDGYFTQTASVTVSNANVTKDVTLTATAISGTVTTGATVTLYQNGTVKGTVVATDGSYAFNNVALGNYTLVFSLKGYHTQTASVSVSTANVTKDVTLVSARYTVSGTTTAGATVTLYQNGAVYMTTTADGSGNYSFSDVIIGNYALTFTKNGYISQGSTCTVTADLSIGAVTLQPVPFNSTKVTVDAVAANTYNVRLIEPWALRVNVTFYTEKNGTAIDLSTFKSYGAYAIIAHKYGDGTTAPTSWEDIVNDPNAVQFRQAAGEGDGNMFPISNTTARFDFYDGLYTYRLAENVYWVAYYEDVDGIHFTDVVEPVLMKKVDNIITKISGDEEQDTQRIVLEHMKQLHYALKEFRGEDAELGKDYTNDVGVLNYGQNLNATNSAGYQFGKTHSIHLIEPWGLMVTYQVKPKSGAVLTDSGFANLQDYGMIFYHDKEKAYNGDMTAAQVLAMNDVHVYSMSRGNVVLEDGKMTAIYANELYTYILDSDVFCLPFVVDAEGNYHYSTNANRMNLLDQMYAYYNRTNLSNKERATFRAMIELYESTIIHRKKYGK